MAKSNDDIISLRHQGGILASALADLQKYGNVTSHYNAGNGINSLSDFGSKSIPIDKSTKEVTPQLISVYNSPRSNYSGIISTALRREISTTENGYIPSQYEQQSFTNIGTSFKILPPDKSLSKEPILLNGHKSSINSFDRTLSTNDSILQSARYTGRNKGSKGGMISKWLHDIAESTPDLSNRKEIANVVVSPRTGILGLLLKKKTKFRNGQICKSTNSLSSSPDPTISESYSISKEPRTSRKNRSLLNLQNVERNYDKHFSLEDLDVTTANPSPRSIQSIFSRKDGTKKDRRVDYMKWSIQDSTSKDSKSSTTSTGLLTVDDDCGKNLSVKV